MGKGHIGLNLVTSFYEVKVTVYMQCVYNLRNVKMKSKKKITVIELYV